MWSEEDSQSHGSHPGATPLADVTFDLEVAGVDARWGIRAVTLREAVGEPFRGIIETLEGGTRWNRARCSASGSSCGWSVAMSSAAVVVSSGRPRQARRRQVRTTRFTWSPRFGSSRSAAIRELIPRARVRISYATSSKGVWEVEWRSIRRS